MWSILSTEGNKSKQFFYENRVVSNFFLFLLTFILVRNNKFVWIMSSNEISSDILVSSESERSLEELYSSFASLEVFYKIKYINIANNG